MPRHAAGNRPVDDGPAPVAPDPRHRPVLLHMAPRPHSRPDSRSLPPTMGTAMALAALMCLTGVSGWAGWRVAQAGTPAQVLATAPAVPRTPAAGAQVLAAGAPPAAPVDAPAGQHPSVADVVFSGAKTPDGSGATASGPGTIDRSSPAGSAVVEPAAVLPV
ncbi:MAG: hypothetical protein JWP46_4329, partial [Modestobacter sp.]|nr:hypothetical protein [Modestobacter sp.]